MESDSHFVRSDFKNSIANYFRNTRYSPKFSDVTLVCEDKYELEANKFVLSASSLFFEEILSRISHPNPVIYLRGVDQNTLINIVDFIYNGEVTVEYPKLQNFLSLGEDLEVKGLLESLHGKQDNIETEGADNIEKTTKENVYLNVHTMDASETQVKQELNSAEILQDDLTLQDCSLKYIDDKDAWTIPNYWTQIKVGDPGSSKTKHQMYGEYYNRCNLDNATIGPEKRHLEKHWRKYHSEKPCDRLISVTEHTREEVIGSIIDRDMALGQYTCKICGFIKTIKEKGRSELYRHVETKHITGVSFDCELCINTNSKSNLKVVGGRQRCGEFRSRSSFRWHMRNSHKILMPKKKTENKPVSEKKKKPIRNSAVKIKKKYVSPIMTKSILSYNEITTNDLLR